jgi:hypothetical protein
LRAKRWLLASLLLTALLGCGGDTSVATFIASLVASTVTLSFQLTVVDKVKQADTDSMSVIVQP